MTSPRKSFAPRPWRVEKDDSANSLWIVSADDEFVERLTKVEPDEPRKSLLRRARLICRAVNGWKGKL